MKKEGIQQGEQATELIQERFRRQRDFYETLYQQGADTLERAFDFMEAAFARGQEMVLFVTELNTAFYPVWFLQEYDCERYYYYNKELLFQEKRQKLLKEIDEL